MIIPTLFLSAALTLSNSQSDDSLKRLKLESIEISVGQAWSQGSAFSLKDISSIAQENDFLNMNFEGYQTGRSCCGAEHHAFNFNVNLALRKKNLEPLLGNPILRLGLSYNTGFYNSIGFYKNERFTVDSVTVIYQGQTNKYAVDSVYNENYVFSTYSQRIRLNTALLLRSESSRRWTWSAGIGVGFGLGLSSEVEAYSSIWSNIENPVSLGTSSPSFQYPNWHDIAYTSEIYKTTALSDFNLSIPLGVDFRVGKKENLLSKLHLFSEVTPTLWATNYAKSIARVNPGIIFSFGFRAYL